MYNHIPFNHNPHISHIYTHQNGSILWLGDEQAAKDEALLRRLIITAILTVADGVHLEFLEHSGSKYEYMVVRAADMPSYQIGKHFGETNKFIYENLAKGRNTLVHCSAGISRSVTIVIAFLIRKLNFEYKKALQHVQNRRPAANPNYGFVQELKKYQYRLSLKDRRVHSSIDGKSDIFQQHNNVISSLIERKRQEEKEKLRQAFQFRRGLGCSSGASVSFDSRIGTGRRKTEIEIPAPRYESVGSGRDSKSKQKDKIKQQILSNLRAKKQQKQQKHSQIRKRVDTENNILFPKIVLVKKLDQLNNKNH